MSAASAWEVAIKRAAGRLDAPDDLVEALAADEFETLDITPVHAPAAGSLPPHHSDPSDRILIAQAQAENLTLVTVDDRFPRYEVDLLPIA